MGRIRNFNSSLSSPEKPMDINQFLLALLEGLSGLPFVDKVDFQTEVFIVKGRVSLQKNRFLQVYFNEITGTLAFALIEEDRRIWGIDFDNLRDWHFHPLENPEHHVNTHPQTIEELIGHLL
jgi:hypothetical protein